MSATLSPSSVAELVDAVRASPRMIAVGAGTKPRLSNVDRSFARVSTERLSGIVEYEPSEYTFTALAGTPLRDIAAELAARGQYLPFEPPFADAGATLGGTVAAGLSGPGRIRFGGLRDFILGVQFVDGTGRLLRAGGKVVKNAAGFDLPKFFGGSAGRFGVLAELTFKVFPKAPATLTLCLTADDAKAKARILSEAARERWELTALDAPAWEDAVYARLEGPGAALGTLSQEILARWPGEILSAARADELWQGVSAFNWAHAGGTLVKVSLSPNAVPDFIGWIESQTVARGWVSAGGNAGYVSLPVGTALPDLGWPAMTLRGDAVLWPGMKPRFEVMAALKTALDAPGRFPQLDD